DAGDIVAAGTVGGGRAPAEDLLVARRERSAPAKARDIELEMLTAHFELRGIHEADLHGDAEPLKLGPIGKRDARLRRVGEQDLEGEGMAACSLHEAAGLEAVARGFEEIERGAAIVAGG